MNQESQKEKQESEKMKSKMPSGRK